MKEETQNNVLFDYKKSITSQKGEDGVLSRVFEIIGRENSWCVEFGAGNGKSDSNTWNLIVDKGWSGVLIEAHPVYFKKLAKRYENNPRVICFREIVGLEEPNTLDAILSRTEIPQSFDLLIIDIDGNDYHVWDSLENYTPRVVMIEYNARIAPDVDFTQPKDGSVNGGSSLAAIINLGKKKGYELVFVEGCNAIFVSEHLFSAFGIQDNSLSVMRDKAQPDTRFFQLYDGSIVLYGCESTHLMCHKKKFAKHPVWFLKDGKLVPLTFTRDRKAFRFIKNAVKNSFLYPFLYESIRNFYGKRWKRKKQSIKKLT